MIGDKRRLLYGATTTSGKKNKEEAQEPSRRFGVVALICATFVYGAAVSGGLVSSPEAAVALSRLVVSDPRVEYWTAGTEGEEQVLEEHYVQWPCFGQQTYAYWRFGLNKRDRGPKTRVQSFSYADPKNLIYALERRQIGENAIVFLDVRYTALDTKEDFEILRDDYRVDIFLQKRVPQMDPTCVYDYTPDLLLRSTLLRRVLAYDRPLTIVLSGDVACRLVSLPETHHRLIFSNDAAQAQCQKVGNAVWWPQGLEGLESYDFFLNPEAARDARTVTENDEDENEKLYLLADAFSVNWRKPSRMALLSTFDTIREPLASLAAKLGLSLDVSASVNDQVSSTVSSPRMTAGPSHSVETQALAESKFNGNVFRAKMASSIFALCPAGDVYSSGRILTALYLGAIPVVDATYETDEGLSAKGCENPAQFWRNGSASFAKNAPFVFVKNWTNLPENLATFDVDKAQQHLATYRESLEIYLRSLVLPGERLLPRSVCEETPFSTADRSRLLDDAADYYQDATWFTAHRDKPDTPGATCGHNVSTEMLGVDIGVNCFDKRCAPPHLRSFHCAFRQKRPGPLRRIRRT